MRISDWSSDVCSSDLTVRAEGQASADAVATTIAVRSGSPAARASSNSVSNVARASTSSGSGSFIGLLWPDEIGRAHSELQSLMRISYAVFCLKKKKTTISNHTAQNTHRRYSLTEQ